MRDRRLLTLDEEAVKRDARAYRARISESLAPAAVSPATPPGNERRSGATPAPKRKPATPARKKPARRS
jgi:hypothetical protein